MESKASHAANPAKGAAQLWAVLACLVFPTIATWIYFVASDGQGSKIQQALYAGSKLVQFAFPALFVWLFLREKWSLPKPTGRGVLPALLFGLASAGGMCAVYYLGLKPSGVFGDVADPASALAKIRDRVAAMGLSSATAYFGFAVFLSGLHSLLEEYYWRWFVFGRLKKFIPVAAAILISSLGFMSHHVIVLASYFGWTSVWTWVCSLGVAVGGAVWSWLYSRYDSLYGPWLSHAIVDAAIFLIGYDLVGDLLR